MLQNSKKREHTYKTRHDWAGKVIHWELCKKFKYCQVIHILTIIQPEE